MLMFFGVSFLTRGYEHEEVTRGPLTCSAAVALLRLKDANFSLACSHCVTSSLCLVHLGYPCLWTIVAFGK